MGKIISPKTLKERLWWFCFITFGTVLILFGFLFLYSRQINNTYEKTIYDMNLLRDYYQNLDAAVLAQRGYLYYEGESDYQEAEEAYEKLWDVVVKLSAAGMDKTCSYEIQNLKEMTISLRLAIEEMYDAMDQYHAGEFTDLTQVNAKYSQVSQVYDAISSEYTSVNESMLRYGDEIYNRVRMQKNIAGILFVIAVAAGGLLLYDQIRAVYNSVVVPTQELIGLAHKVKEGDFSGEIAEKTAMDQEMAMLTEVFESMVVQLKQQIDTLQNNIVMQKKLQESRFKELQLQINPHFMFNTLNMLVQNAYLEQAENTASLLKITAKMFRYSLDFSGRAVSLFREMEELGNYVIIQEQRYGERICFEFELDERFHQMKVPALILQPLVENAVVHGIRNKLQGARIRIETRLKETEDTAEILIEDNGCGMNAEERQRVRKEMENYNMENSAKVGLGNVHMRLKMYFGDRVTMEIDSEEEKGTRIVIRLKDIGGKEDVSCVDCG